MTQKHRHIQPLKEAPDPNVGPLAAARTAFALKRTDPSGKKKKNTRT